MINTMMDVSGLTLPELSYLTGKTVKHLSRIISGEIDPPAYVITILETWPLASAKVKARLLSKMPKEDGKAKRGKGRSSYEEISENIVSVVSAGRRVLVENPGVSYSRYAFAIAIADYEGVRVTAQQVYKRYMIDLMEDLGSEYWDEATDRFQYRR